MNERRGKEEGSHRAIDKEEDKDICVFAVKTREQLLEERTLEKIELLDDESEEEEEQKEVKTSSDNLVQIKIYERYYLKIMYIK